MYNIYMQHAAILQAELVLLYPVVSSFWPSSEYRLLLSTS